MWMSVTDGKGPRCHREATKVQKGEVPAARPLMDLACYFKNLEGKSCRHPSAM